MSTNSTLIFNANRRCEVQQQTQPFSINFEDHIAIVRILHGYKRANIFFIEGSRICDSGCK